MEESLRAARKSAHTIKGKLEELERTSITGDQEKHETLAIEVSANINALSQTVAGLQDSLFSPDGAPAVSKEKYKFQVAHLQEEAHGFRRDLDRYWSRANRVHVEKREREQLFERRRRPGAEGDETAIRIGSLASEKDKLLQANASLDNSVNAAVESWNNIMSQNQTLKATQRKLLDLTSTLGFSSSLIRMIDRRSSQDRWLIYVLTIVMLGLFFWLLWYFRWSKE